MSIRIPTTITDAIAGLSPDAPMTVTPQGGKHSAVGVAFHQIPARALFEVARVLHQGGSKYGRDNWRQISTEDHINHALMHIYGDLGGDSQDEHLIHAATRVLMALEVRLTGGPQRSVEGDIVEAA